MDNHKYLTDTSTTVGRIGAAPPPVLSNHSEQRTNTDISTLLLLQDNCATYNDAPDLESYFTSSSFPGRLRIGRLL